tara:strand:+ start:11916 stop:12944 length:1029 start_codon:yes stop_codon:yes gene_type:complete
MKSILLILYTGLSWATNPVVLQDINKTVEDGRLVLEYTFNDRIDSRKVNLDFINETLQIDVPKAFIEEKKRFTNVEDDKVRSLYSYQMDKDTLRLRIIYDQLKADSLQDKVTTRFSGNKMRVLIDDGRIPFKEVSTELPEKVVAPTIQVEDIVVSDGKDSVTKNTEAVSVAVEQEKTAEEMKKDAAYDEAAIPVFANVQKTEKKEKQSGLNQMAMAVGIVFLTIIGMFLLLRRWSKTKYKNPHTHIKVLTQHHLGPKKTLAIVSVAGESILLGITESNINMIKSLSLMDEDLPEDLPQNFDGAFREADERMEDKEQGIEEDKFNVMGIKDVVRTRLKDMREL